MARLGIVTVSDNTCAILGRCLSSLLASLSTSGLTAEVVVVDFGAANGTADMVRREFAGVRVMAAGRSTGPAAGANQGLRALGFPGEDGPEYGLLLSPDMVVRGQTPAEMVAFMDGVPEAGACGARLVREDGAFEHSAYHFPSPARALLDFSTPDSCPDGGYPRRLYAAGRPFAVDWVPWGALLMRRGAPALVGLFDERFESGGAVTDWCRCARKGGWRTFCLPRAEIMHLRGGSPFSEDEFVALWRSRYLYLNKHEGRLYRTVVRWIVEAGLDRMEARALQLRDRGKLDREAFGRRRQACARVRNLGKAAQ